MKPESGNYLPSQAMRASRPLKTGKWFRPHVNMPEKEVVAFQIGRPDFFTFSSWHFLTQGSKTSEDPTKNGLYLTTAASVRDAR